METALTPGCTARLTRDGASERVLVLCLHEARAEVEREGGVEELVDVSMLRPLEPFEGSTARRGEESAVDYAERCKANGNVLFKLRDLGAALAWYQSGSRALHRGAPIEPGARVLVLPGDGEPMRSALVLTHDGDECAVEYEPAAASVASVCEPADGSDNAAAGGVGWMSWLRSTFQPSGGAARKEPPAEASASSQVASDVASLLQCVESALSRVESGGAVGGGGGGVGGGGGAVGGNEGGGGGVGGGMGEGGAGGGWEVEGEEETVRSRRLLPLMAGATALPSSAHRDGSRVVGGWDRVVGWVDLGAPVRALFERGALLPSQRRLGRRDGARESQRRESCCGLPRPKSRAHCSLGSR